MLTLHLALMLSTASAMDWTTHPLPGVEGSTVSLPGVVQRKHAEKGVVIGRVVSDTLLVEHDRSWAAVTVTSAPRFALSLAGPMGVANRARDAILEDTAGTLTTWEPTSRGGREGMALGFRIGGPDGRGRTGRAEVYTWDAIVLTITTVERESGDAELISGVFEGLVLPGPGDG